MNRFKLALKFSRLDNSLQGFLKKYKTAQNTNIKSTYKPLEYDNNQKNTNQVFQQNNQQNTADMLKQKYLLSKAKKVDLNEKDPFSHFNRAQELALEKQINKVKKDYKQELEVLKLHEEGEMLIDDSLLPDDFLEGLDEARKEGIEQIEQGFDMDSINLLDDGHYKFKSLEEWKSYMHFEKPLINKMMNIQLKKYPGTEKGNYPHQDPEGFTKWIQDNHTQEEVETIENFLQLGYGEQIEKEVSDSEEEEGESDNELNEEIGEEKWETISPGPALFVEETMVDMVVKGTPIEDLADNQNIQIFNGIPQDEVRPIPEKLPLEKEELIDYLERWSFYRSIQGYEFIKDGFEGKYNNVEMKPIKQGSLNTYYQTLPKSLRDHPNIKNVYRGLEFGNNHMSLYEKEEALNYAAKTSCPFDELNDYVFDKGSSGYKPMASRFDEERLIQDQENEHVDQAIQPEVTRKFIEQRQHTTLHTNEGDIPAPDWVVDKMERVDDLPVDYYINDDGFWDDYIKAKEQKHLSDTPIFGGKKYFRHI